jgi:nicotinamidase/pyrazinamidase
MILGGAAMPKEVEKTGVIVVDVQGDFTTYKNGSLSVEGTDKAYIKAVEKGTKKLKDAGLSIFVTQDWHPSNHMSFYTSHKGKKAFDLIKIGRKVQVLWPPHCVQKTPGADILIDKTLFKAIVKKGMNPKYDSYSGFKDDGGKKTEMDTLLKKNKIKKLVIYGIATDYCVRATTLDALAAGYKVILIKKLCRGVAPNTSQKSIKEMKSKGIVILEGLSLAKIKSS